VGGSTLILLEWVETTTYDDIYGKEVARRVAVCEIVFYFGYYA